MPAAELENELRRMLTRAATDMKDPQQAGQRLLQRDYRPGRGHRQLATGAAALVLIGGASYGAVAALTGPAARTATASTATAALTSVSGCHGLKQADGTLEQVTGTTLVIKTAAGQQVTVTTTASTMVAMSRVPLGYITDGTHVIVNGPRSGGTITADIVDIQPPSGGIRGKPQTPHGIVAARGTVTREGAAGFTLVTAGGTRIPVTTSSSTDVEIPPPGASLSQLRTGHAAIAVGRTGPHGTLSATFVAQPLSGKPGKIQVGNCSPRSIEAAVTTALATGG